jgi:hypothetical protein
MNSAEAYKLARTIAKANDEAREYGVAMVEDTEVFTIKAGTKTLAFSPSKPAQNELKYVK